MPKTASNSSRSTWPGLGQELEDPAAVVVRGRRSAPARPAWRSAARPFESWCSARSPRRPRSAARSRSPPRSPDETSAVDAVRAAVGEESGRRSRPARGRPPGRGPASTRPCRRGRRPRRRRPSAAWRPGSVSSSSPASSAAIARAAASAARAQAPRQPSRVAPASRAASVSERASAAGSAAHAGSPGAPRRLVPAAVRVDDDLRAAVERGEPLAQRLRRRHVAEPSTSSGSSAAGRDAGDRVVGPDDVAASWAPRRSLGGRLGQDRIARRPGERRQRAAASAGSGWRPARISPRGVSRDVGRESRPRRRRPGRCGGRVDLGQRQSSPRPASASAATSR